MMRFGTKTPEPIALNPTSATPRVGIGAFHPTTFNTNRPEGNPNSQSHNDLIQTSQNPPLPPRQHAVNQSMV
jgi:hypothetical protein